MTGCFGFVTRLPRPWTKSAIGLLALVLASGMGRPAFALIMGGAGNSPVADPGWPKGAASIVNQAGRVAWWEGPPLGGGEWHAECRGDARALGAVLADFGRLDVTVKRVVLHDGVGHSFWLNPNGEPARRDTSTINWAFTVWQPDRWSRLRSLPADLNPTEPGDPAQGPPSVLDVYAGGGLRWADVTVPQGLEVVDQRLAAHGFGPDDGTVLEGKVVDLETQRPVASRMRLHRIERQPRGGYPYLVAAEAGSDATGRWVLKQAPAGWYRIVVEAAGYVPRVAGQVRLDNQPQWSSYNVGLVRSAPVSGQVKDDSGKPLADVEVRLDNVATRLGGRYEVPVALKTRTDAEGRFRFDQVPMGGASVWVHKTGYCRPGLGLKITTPASDLALAMKAAAQVQVTVDFGAASRPDGYLVRIEPEGGAVVGSWSGSGNIDAKNQIAFHDVPPGRYILQGQPNPSSAGQESKAVAVDLKGGRTLEVTLSAGAK